MCCDAGSFGLPVSTHVPQVMAEGEQLSIKQSGMETTTRRLRSDLKALQSESEQLSRALAAANDSIQALTANKTTVEQQLQVRQPQGW